MSETKCDTRPPVMNKLLGDFQDPAVMAERKSSLKNSEPLFNGLTRDQILKESVTGKQRRQRDQFYP